MLFDKISNWLGPGVLMSNSTVVTYNIHVFPCMFFYIRPFSLSLSKTAKCEAFTMPDC
jgi:hypothetical protein